MTWFRVDDMSAMHQKVMAAGNAAWGAFCRMGAHSSHYELDGFVPDEAAAVLSTPEERARLIQVNFLTPAPGGYDMHDFLDWNPSASDLEQVRLTRAKAGKRGGKRSAASRKAKRQANEQASASVPAEQTGSKGIGIGIGPGSGSGFRGESARGEALDLGAEPADAAVEVGAVSETRLRLGPPNASADGAFGMAVAAWVEGLRLVTGQPFVPPRGAELGKLLDAFGAFGPDVEGRVAWARETAAAYAAGRAGEVLNVHRFVDWLNSDRPKRPVGGPGLRDVQRAPATGRRWKVGKA